MNIIERLTWQINHCQTCYESDRQRRIVMEDALKEITRLRELVQLAYSEGYSKGMSDQYHKYLKHYEKAWSQSQTKQELEK